MDSTFLKLCGRFLDQLSNDSTRKSGINEVLEAQFDGKLSEDEYIRYLFSKALNEMYKAGLEAKEEAAEPESLVVDEWKYLKIHQRPRTTKRTVFADRFAIEMAPFIKVVRDQGYVTLQAIADRLTELGKTPMEGGRWHPASVRSVEARISKILNRQEKMSV